MNLLNVLLIFLIFDFADQDGDYVPLYPRWVTFDSLTFHAGCS